jgi:hypothetical protein
MGASSKRTTAPSCGQSGELEDQAERQRLGLAPRPLKESCTCGAHAAAPGS